MFNPTPSGHDDRSLRVQLQAVQSGAPRKLFAVTPQVNHIAGAEVANFLREDKNDDRLIVIGKGTQMRAEINNCSKIEISGYIEGSVVAVEVIVREGGCLKGHVQSRRIEVHGIIEGEVQVEEYLDIRSTGEASGELTYGKLSVAPGGKLAGKIQSYLKPEEQEVPPQHAEPFVNVDQKRTSLSA